MRLIFPPSKLVKRQGGGPGAGFRLLEDARGVTAIEYALIAGLIALAFLSLITQIGDFVSVPFDTVASYL